MNENRMTGIADFIRARSSAGELASLTVIESEFGDPVPDHMPEPAEALLQAVMLGHEDIQVIPGEAGRPFCYSDRFMTGA